MTTSGNLYLFNPDRTDRFSSPAYLPLRLGSVMAPGLLDRRGDTRYLSPRAADAEIFNSLNFVDNVARSPLGIHPLSIRDLIALELRLALFESRS